VMRIDLACLTFGSFALSKGLPRLTVNCDDE
jgi:hypothetical protein